MIKLKTRVTLPLHDTYIKALIFILLASQMALSIMNHKVAIAVQFAGIACMCLAVVIKQKVKLSRFFLWYLLLTAVSVLSCYIATDAVDSYAFNMLQLLAVVFLLDQFTGDGDRLEFVCDCYILCCVIAGTWLTIKSLAAGDSRLGTSVSSSLPIWIGSFSSLSFCLCVFLATKYRKRRKGVFYVLGAFVCFFILILTGSRKYYISVFGALGFLVLRKKKGRALRITAALIAVAVFAYLIFKVPFLYEAIGRRFVKLLDFVETGDGGADKSAAVRSEFLKLGWAAFKDKPLFGHGMWSWNSVTGYGTHPHNNYIDLLFSLGLVGCAYYYLFVFNIIRRFWTRASDKMTGMFYSISLFAMLVMDYFQRSFAFDPVILFLYLAYTESRQTRTVVSGTELDACLSVSAVQL